MEEGSAHGRWWACCPELYKNVGWAIHGKQASKEHSSMVSESAFISRFQPCLSSFTGFLEWWAVWPVSVRQMNPFLYNLFCLVIVFHQSDTNPDSGTWLMRNLSSKLKIIIYVYCMNNFGEIVPKFLFYSVDPMYLHIQEIHRPAHMKFKLNELQTAS